MKAQKKKVPSAKAVTLVELGCLILICGLFFAGLVKVPDTSFSGIIDNINLQIDMMDGLDGFAALCTVILESTWPIVALVFAAVILIKLLLCWISVARVKKIGWSVASIRLGKKLRSAAVWVLTYMLFCLTVFGKKAGISVCGIIVLVLIGAFILVRVILDHTGKKDKKSRMACSISATAVICIFSLVLFIYLLTYSSAGYSLWGRAFASLESMLKGKTFARNFMYICSVVSLFLAINVARSVVKKQITMNKSGVIMSVIFLFVWIFLAAMFDFVAYSLQGKGGSGFGGWLNSMKFMFIAVILGAADLVLMIVASIVGNIGKEKEPKEKDEDEEGEDSEDKENEDGEEDAESSEDEDGVEDAENAENAEEGAEAAENAEEGETAEPVEGAEADGVTEEIAGPTEEAGFEMITELDVPAAQAEDVSNEASESKQE